jgi:CMP-N,N'-diacetyllegionaminic acid synthase
MPSEKHILAIIPARSGSKGVPGKNIRPLAGKPLLGWMVEAAKRSRHITRVICSTDSPLYAEIARRHGADTPFLRPAEFATDKATDIQVLTHATEWLERHEGYRPDIILRLQPTNPTFPTELIDAGIAKLLADPAADSVRAVAISPKHPFKMWRLCPDEDRIEPFFGREITGFDEAFNMGRQQLPTPYLQVGVMEVLRHRTLMGLRSMAGQRILPLIVDDELHTIDIDTELDFTIAEFAMQQLARTAPAHG